MKALKISAAAILIMMALSVSAQVTGNVKLADIHQNLLTNYGGIKVEFTSTAAPAVTDSTVTDSLGNYIKTLVAGTYHIRYSINGFVSKLYLNVVIPNGASPQPNRLLYQDYPSVSITTPLSGTLQPYKRYTTNFYDTIRVGDTLVVPAGAWLSASRIIVNGVLKIQGTAQEPAVVCYGYQTNLGYYPDSTVIKMGANGKVLMDHAAVYTSFTGRDCSIDITNCSNNKLRQYGIMDSLSTNLSAYGGGTLQNISADLHHSTLNISDCEISLTLNVFDTSTVNINCNRIYRYSDFMYYWSGTVINIYNNLVTSGFTRAFDCGNVHVIDNYFDYATGMQIYNSQPQRIDVTLTNNSFEPIFSGPGSGYGDAAEIYGNIDAHVVNNLSLNFGPNFNSLPPANFVDFKYNMLTYPFTPDTVILPSGTPRIVVNYSHDTTDQFGNYYQTSSPYLYKVYDTFPNFQAGADTFFFNLGDPTIVDPDGSPSDRGARRDTNLCPNHAIPTPAIPGGLPVLAINDSVWPGDADYDGVANNNDLLPIGVKYGATGPVRANASQLWTPQYCAMWSDTLASGRNIKHADCNGDGTIDSMDINAIYLNYSLTHVVHKQSSTGSDLWLQFPSDSLFEGDTVTVGVMLGDSVNTINNIYGLAFSISYDTAFIKAGSATMSYQPCWLGTQGMNMISLFKEPTPGRYDFALCRTNKQIQSGGGQIGSLVIVINDDILAKKYLRLSTTMPIIDIKAIDQHEVLKNISGANDSMVIYVGDTAIHTAIREAKKTSVNVYPNPAKDNVVVQISSLAQGTISLLAMDGHLLSTTGITGTQTILNISAIPVGLYIIKIESGQSVTYRKVQVNR